MRSISGIAIFIFILINPSSAQIQRTPLKQPVDTSVISRETFQQENPRKDIFRELNLSREQKQHLKKISQSTKAAKETIENDATLTASDKKAKLRTLRKNNALKIDAMLTEEQKIKFRRLKENKNAE